MSLPQELLLLATLIVPMATGVVEVLKQALTIKKNFIPLIGLFVGVCIGFIAAPLSDADIYLRLWAGGIAGLTSSGLYELVTKRNGTTKE